MSDTDGNATSASSNSTAAAERSPQRSVAYDPAWYTWGKFFSILTNNASYEDTARYVHMKSLHHEEADCRRCVAHRDWLFKYSPVVRFLRDKTAQLGGELNEQNVICRRCDTLAANGAAMGGHDSKHGILLCANHLPSKSYTEDVLAHEMVHAYDNLRFKYNKDDLRHVACTEIRASTLSGECRWTREFFGNGQWAFTRHFQDCVRRRAVMSVKMSKHCMDDVQAVKVVNQVWDSCFKDTRPFDEIYR